MSSKRFAEITCTMAGKFYTLTTGANERRWEKMKDKLHEMVDSFKIFDVWDASREIDILSFSFFPFLHGNLSCFMYSLLSQLWFGLASLQAIHLLHAFLLYFFLHYGCNIFNFNISSNFTKIGILHTDQRHFVFIT